MRKWAFAVIISVLVCLLALLLSLVLKAQTPAAPPALRVRPDPKSDTTTPGQIKSITCPASAVFITPGASIQAAVTNNPATSVFCLRAGTHPITSAITPKTGNTFVGEYGAILDATGWKTADTTQGVFRAHNENIDDVTIRNLVIRNYPQRGVHAYKDYSNRWTLEHNDIGPGFNGVSMPDGSKVLYNYIHHNTGIKNDPDPGRRGGGYGAYLALDSIFEGNEIAYNGQEQKIMSSANVIFRNNYVHHNVGDGIWYDGENPGALIEGNRAEDNGGTGIFWEGSYQGRIINNTVVRNADKGIFVSSSYSTDVSGNFLEDNFRAIEYMVNCGVLGRQGLDVRDNWSHDNIIRVSTQPQAFATGMTYTSDCTSAQIALYFGSLSKNNKFSRNTYYVPTGLTTFWWVWNGVKNWDQWHALGQDTDSTLRQR